MLSPTRDTPARVRAPLPAGPVDVAVVGCGLGGLTAGAALSRAGLSVALFDPHYVAGGCATMFERGRASRRFCFDVGLHYIGDCGPEGEIPTILRDVGVSLQYEPLDPDGYDTIVLPGLRFRIPVGHDRYRERLAEAFPREKRGIDRYLRFLREVDGIKRQIAAAGGRMGRGVLAWMALSGRMLLRYRNATMAEVLDSCTRDPALRAVILGQSGDHGLPPSKVSALLHAGLANHYFAGAFYPRGGGQVIADKLADTIEAAGGTIHLRAGVERILVEGGRAAGVRLEARKGEAHELRARAVLSNADLKRTLLELLGPQHLPDAWLTRAHGFEMGGAIFMTFLGLDADAGTLGMGRCNYWQYDSTDLEEIYGSAWDEQGWIRARAAYITSGTLKDPATPGHAPEGMSTLEVMTLVPGHPSAWGAREDEIETGRYRKGGRYLEQKRRIERDLIGRVEALFPGAREAIVFRESATPVTHTRYTRATGGTGYGLACTPAQFMKGRPGYRGPLPGLYLAGASTRAGHGVLGAMSSGREAARRILKDLGPRAT